MISAASASQICDGSSAVLVVSEQALKDHGLTPLARIHNLTVTAGDPVIMLEEPLFATDRALQRAGMTIADIDLYEVNEAFAPVPLAWLEHVGADPERLNVHGGAIALGHPLGASGAKLMATLVHALRRARQALRPADDVRRRRHRQRDHRRGALRPMPGPLAGIRILEMAGLGPAPFCGMMLADHGAEVIRIEREGGWKLPGDPMLRSRRTIQVDLKQADGIAVVRDLAQDLRRADRGLPARGDGAARARAGRAARRQSEARLRPDDRLGAGRAARAGGRARHQLHRLVGRAAHGRARRPAGAAGQLSRRFRRRRHAARLRHGERAAGGAGTARRAR